MPFNIENSIARIDILDHGRVQSWGTGFVIAHSLVLTAYHVLADRDVRNRLVPRSADIALTFPAFCTKASILKTCYDPGADFALLLCERHPPDALPLRLAELGHALGRKGPRWTTFGFPKDASATLNDDSGRRIFEGIAGDGEVTDWQVRYEDTEAIQLFLKQAGAGHGLGVEGFSGSPVLVEGAVVGLLRSALLTRGPQELSIRGEFHTPLGKESIFLTGALSSAQQSQRLSKGGIVWACPIVKVWEALEKADPGRVPKPPLLEIDSAPLPPTDRSTLTPPRFDRKSALRFAVLVLVLALGFAGWRLYLSLQPRQLPGADNTPINVNNSQNSKGDKSPNVINNGPGAVTITVQDQPANPKAEVK